MVSTKDVVAIAIAALTVVVILAIGPFFGSTIDDADPTQDNAYATGVLTLTANVSTGELVNITAGGVTYAFEFNTTGTGVTAGYINVPVTNGYNTSVLAGSNLTTAINNNATLAALITASNSAAVTTITADVASATANSYGTTDTVTSGWAAATMSGGAAPSDWSSDSDSGIESPATTWVVLVGMIVLMFLGVVIGKVIGAFRDMGKD